LSYPLCVTGIAFDRSAEKIADWRNYKLKKMTAKILFPPGGNWVSGAVCYNLVPYSVSSAQF
jgi:hypothetical protein